MQARKVQGALTVVLVPLETEVISGKRQKERWVVGKEIQTQGLGTGRKRRTGESVTVQSHRPCWQEV